MSERSSGADRLVPLAAGLAAWCVKECTCAHGLPGHLKQCRAAATFSAFCEPRKGLDPEAFIAAKCCLLFFLVDDGSADQLNVFDHFLRTGERSEGNEPTACYVSLLVDLRSRGCDVRELDTALRAWSACMRTEQSLDLSSLILEEYACLRKETIFVSCLVRCWLSLLRVSIPDEHSADCTALLDIAIRAVIIANDIGSLRVDETNHSAADHLVDINSVLVQGRRLGSTERAVRRAVDEYNALAADLRVAQRDFAPHDADAAWKSTFLNIVSSVVDGNLEGTRHLTAERYPGGRDLLRELDSVREAR